MYSLVRHKTHFVTKMLSALLALVRPLPCMQQIVVLQMDSGLEGFITLITIEFSDIFVECVYVRLQSARLRKTFVAKLTTYLMANAVGSEMIP